MVGSPHWGAWGLGGVAKLLLLLVCTVQMLKSSFLKNRKTWAGTLNIPECQCRTAGQTQVRSALSSALCGNCLGCKHDTHWVHQGGPRESHPNTHLPC